MIRNVPNHLSEKMSYGDQETSQGKPSATFAVLAAGSENENEEDFDEVINQIEFVDDYFILHAFDSSG